MMTLLRRMLIGRPLHNEEIAREKLPKWKALAIFSSDALSSVAYGPEQVMLTLAIPGILAYGYFAPIGFAILLLLAVVTASYIQVARANPGGGGSYSVAKHNLGEWPALVAAASLFTDYTLTVAVSISAGTAAIVSAFPALAPHEVLLDLAVLSLILTIINLRGVRESSTTFVLPTYSFVVGMVLLIIAGSYQAIINPVALIPPASVARQWDWAILFLVFRAFANGCSSMTGVEAISNGVPMFKSPEVRNAGITTIWMSSILGVMFAGVTFLSLHHHILPIENITLLSQLAETTFGRGFMYYYIQVTTMLVLYLAANTSYNGLPPLLSILAKDGYMPRYLAARGERLAFSNGIILLSVVAGLLIIAFKGNTEHLISLYAIGVFLSFTIAQTGMIRHWHREKGANWVVRSILNGVGAIITGLVVLVIAVTKFFNGAWLVLIFIPIMIFAFKKIRAHYNDMADQLSLSNSNLPNIAEAPVRKNLIIVPVAGPTHVVAETLRYAKTLGGDIHAVNISVDQEEGKRIRAKWETWNPGVPLTIIYSPFRQLNRPLIKYIEKVQKWMGKDHYITVLIPEFETKKLWHRLLHNQTGWFLRMMLILKENVVVSTIPYHLKK